MLKAFSRVDALNARINAKLLGQSIPAQEEESEQNAYVRINQLHEAVLQKLRLALAADMLNRVCNVSDTSAAVAKPSTKCLRSKQRQQA